MSIAVRVALFLLPALASTPLSAQPKRSLELSPVPAAPAGAGWGDPRARESAFVPDDPLFAAQWPFENHLPGGTVDADVDAPEAWRITRGSPDVVIAVLDDGVQTDHPDLAANISSRGRDFRARPYTDDGSPRAQSDIHGTAVAGIAAARGGNGRGISGMCPLCTILPIRVSRSSTPGTAAAFAYAVEQGADVIVAGWGYRLESTLSPTDAVADAIDRAAARGRGGRGAVIVFAVPNEAVDACRGAHPDVASLDSVIAVGVSDHDDRLGGSAYGDCLDIVAPAKPRYRNTAGVVTTDRTGEDGHVAGDYFRAFGGTSAAAPMVAGLAGLLLSVNERLSRTDVQRILEHTADKIDPINANYDGNGFSTRGGYGRINAGQALTPTVRIAVSSPEVAAGSAFSVTVTASAPLGIDRVSWGARGISARDLQWREDAVADGRTYYSRTWTGLSLDEPGTFRLEASVRSLRGAVADELYPYEGSTPNDGAAGLLTVLPAASSTP